jgi:hypothetical protein
LGSTARFNVPSDIFFGIVRRYAAIIMFKGRVDPGDVDWPSGATWLKRTR